VNSYDFRVDDDYYYFGFESEEARADAHQRALVRIAEIREEGWKKPHHLKIFGLEPRGLLRWIELATGMYGCRENEARYGFDTVEELEAAVDRVRVCPEYRPEYQLLHISQPNGKPMVRERVQDGWVTYKKGGAK
jgi:hypothetical protein